MPSRKLETLVADGDALNLLQYAPQCGVWLLNTYDACDLVCTYCCTYAQGQSRPRVDVVDVPNRIRDEIRDLPAGVLISAGTLIDCYPRAEAKFGATRAVLEALLPLGHPLGLTTKGTTILRDIDLLRGWPDACITVSISTVDEDLAKVIEPAAPSVSDRLEVVDALLAAGVKTLINAQPWIPGMSDVGALYDLVDRRCPILVGPLDVRSPMVASTPLGRQFSQGEIKDAYEKHREEIGERPDLVWREPPWWGMKSESVDLTGLPAWSSGDGADRVSRNIAVVRRLDAAGAEFRTGDPVMALVSPHLRHYASPWPERSIAAEGRGYVDTLIELGMCVRDLERRLVDVRGEGDRVHTLARFTGETAHPIGGWQPGDRFEGTVQTVYRFDGNGLVVEMWRDLQLSPHSALAATQ